MRARVLAVVVFAVVQIGFALSLLLGYRPAAGEPAVDLSTYLLAARAMRSGLDVYTLSIEQWSELANGAGITAFAPPYRYTPLTAALLQPFADVPLPVVFAVWSLLGVAALAVSALLLSRAATGRWIDPVAFLATGTWGPALSTIYTGQVNAVALVSVTASLALPTVTGGAFTGLAAALKPIAAPLLALDAFRARWRRVGVGLGALILSALVGGVGPFASYVAHVLDISVLAAVPVVHDPRDQSLLSAAAWAMPGSPDLARAVGTALSATVIGVAVFVARRGDVGLGVGVVCAAAALAAPISWYHNLTIAVVLVPFLWRTVGPVGKAAIVSSLAMIDLYAVTWRQLAEMGFVSVPTFACLVLLALGLVAIARGARPIHAATSAAAPP